jgi:hypothetical protein
MPTYLMRQEGDSMSEVGRIPGKIQIEQELGIDHRSRVRESVEESEKSKRARKCVFDLDGSADHLPFSFIFLAVLGVRL